MNKYIYYKLYCIEAEQETPVCLTCNFIFTLTDQAINQIWLTEL